MDLLRAVTQLKLKVLFEMLFPWILTLADTFHFIKESQLIRSFAYIVVCDIHICLSSSTILFLFYLGFVAIQAKFSQVIWMEFNI